MASSTEDTDPFETAVLKSAVQQNCTFIAETIRSREFCTRLFSAKVFSLKEYEHLKQEQGNKGDIHQVELCLEYVVKKPAGEFWKGMDVLQKILNGEVIYRKLQETVVQIKAGKLTLLPEYDQEPAQIAVSVATILLKEGQELVQQRLKREIRDSSFKTVSKALKDKEEAIRQCRDGTDGKVECILKSQFQKLFPNRKPINSLESLDMSLLTIVYKILFDVSLKQGNKWTVLPNDDDCSLHGHLERLHFIRNWCFANLLKPNQTERNMYSLLEKALLGLGAKPISCHQWHCVILHPDMELENNLRDSLRTLISSDVTDIHETMKVLKILLNNHHIDNKEEIGRKIDSIQSQFRSNREQIFTVLNDLPGDILHAALLHSDKLEPQSPLSHHITTCVEELKGEIETQLKENCRELKAHFDRTSEPSKWQSGDINGDFSQMRDEVHNLLSNSEVFKILVLSQPRDRDHDDKEQLCYALGNVKWDVLVDLDHNSRTDSGLHEKIVKVLQQVKHYQTVAYTELDTVTENDESLVANGDKMMWLLLNGCADTGIKSLSKTTKVKALAKLEIALSSILSKLPGRKSLACFNIILGDCDNYPGIGHQVMKRILECCNESEDFIDLSNSCVYSIFTSKMDKNLVPDVSLKHEEHCLTYLDTATLLNKNIFSNFKAKTFVYPGNDGRECHVTTEKMTKYQVYITLYHRDIGRINFESKTEVEIDEIMDAQRTSFLKGQPLTPEAQFIQNKCRVFVVRTEMEKAKEKVEGILKDREEWHKKRPSGHFTIRHDSSGGGTTTAKYLLYSLRNRYPCVEVRRLEGQTTKILGKLFQESKKPLLIVMDNHEFSAKGADELQQALTNEHVKAVVVYVGRKLITDFKQSQGDIDEDLLDETCEEENDGDSIYIPSKIELEDKKGFRELYENVKEGIRASRVILYGLLAFCDEYDRFRLNEHITQWFKSSKVEQKQALGVVILLWRYCQRPIKVSLLNRQTTESNQEVLWQQLFGYYGSDFVKSDKSDPYSVRPIHNCIIDPISDKLAEDMESCDRSSGLLKWFTETLYHSLSKCSTGMDEMATTTRYLLTQRPEGTHLSVFLTELKDVCGRDFAAEQILKFVSLFKDHKHEGHLRALYARYLTYHMDNPEEGLNEITKAVGLKKGEGVLSKHATKESAILGTYGYLYRNKAQSIFGKLIKENPNEALKQSVPLFSEAIDAFQKSQQATMQLKRYTVGPFLGEVKVRLRLLILCFVHCCKRKHDEFQKFLKRTPHQLIKHSEERAMDVLETVDHLERLNKLDELSVYTSRAMVKLKFRLLRFRFDEKKTKQKLIEAVKDAKDLSFDIGLLIRLQFDKIQSVEEEDFQNRMRSWAELRDEELRTIILFVQGKLQQQSSRVLGCNFADILNAMIQVRYNNLGQEVSYGNYNIDYAMLCAEQWGKVSPEDQRALFYMGALKLVKGLESNNVKSMHEGVELLNKTDAICNENPSARDFMARTFAIGKGPGLSALMPYRKDMPREQLRTFEGRQINPKSMMIGVKPYQKFLKAKMYREESSHIDDGQQATLKFCICLRQKFPVVAFYVEKV